MLCRASEFKYNNDRYYSCNSTCYMLMYHYGHSMVLNFIFSHESITGINAYMFHGKPRNVYFCSFFALVISAKASFTLDCGRHNRKHIVLRVV
jgi:hypothetical protein